MLNVSSVRKSFIRLLFFGCAIFTLISGKLGPTYVALWGLSSIEHECFDGLKRVYTVSNKADIFTSYLVLGHVTI